MNKAELIERIVDTFTGMGSEDPIDTAFCSYLTLEEAKTYLNEYRAMEKADFEPDEWLPEEVTPELWMEANNCYIRKCRHDVLVKRITEWLIEDDPVALYDNYRLDYGENHPEIVPIDFWYNYDSIADLPFGHGNKPTIVDMIELIQIGLNSKGYCNFTHEYICYNEKEKRLSTTNHPFAAGMINPNEFAEYIASTPELLEEIREHYLTDEQIKYIFEMEDK